MLLGQGFVIFLSSEVEECSEEISPWGAVAEGAQWTSRIQAIISDVRERDQASKDR